MENAEIPRVLSKSCRKWSNFHGKAAFSASMTATEIGPNIIIATIRSTIFPGVVELGRRSMHTNRPTTINIDNAGFTIANLLSCVFT